MPKAILEFNLPEERDEHELALNGWRYQCQVDDIWNKVFRPRHKHGYANQELDKLVNSKNGAKLMDMLEQLYRDAIHENEE